MQEFRIKDDDTRVNVQTDANSTTVKLTLEKALAAGGITMSLLMPTLLRMLIIERSLVFLAAMYGVSLQRCS